MDTAERLFARYGIDAVTPRQIVLASRQRNQSAIHYHFGSKDGLLAALHASRMADINLRRRELLRGLVARRRNPTLRELLEAVARPLAERAWSVPGGRHYVIFLSHLFADRARRDRAVRAGDAAAELREVFARLRHNLPDLPEAVWQERLRLVLGCIIHGLADRERLRASGRLPPASLPDPRYLANILDVGVAMLRAPVSPQTVSSDSRANRTPTRRKNHGTA
jgi:AcrR family transcriptional regulator